MVYKLGMQTLHQWLLERPGAAKAMSEAFGVSKACISQWRDRGAPVEQLRAISAYTGGAVSVESLLADIEARKLAA